MLGHNPCKAAYCAKPRRTRQEPNHTIMAFSWVHRGGQCCWRPTRERVDRRGAGSGLAKLGLGQKYGAAEVMCFNRAERFEVQAQSGWLLALVTRPRCINKCGWRGVSPKAWLCEAECGQIVGTPLRTAGTSVAPPAQPSLEPPKAGPPQTAQNASVSARYGAGGTDALIRGRIRPSFSATPPARFEPACPTPDQMYPESSAIPRPCVPHHEAAHPWARSHAAGRGALRGGSLAPIPRAMPQVAVGATENSGPRTGAAYPAKCDALHVAKYAATRGIPPPTGRRNAPPCGCTLLDFGTGVPHDVAAVGGKLVVSALAICCQSAMTQEAARWWEESSTPGRSTPRYAHMSVHRRLLRHADTQTH